MAVLRVIAAENLVESANQIGETLANGLRSK
jgi:4-aminobutyrate aminotransferase-like enzyme